MERFAGRYLLLRRLGHGGMGEVFLARDLSTGRECALKRLRRPRADGSMAGLKREFEALVRVRHPAVVAVLEHALAADGTPYLTMEYVPGVPAEFPRGDWPWLHRMAARVAAGLEALHDAGIVHGDLKPSNVLVVPGDGPNGPADVRLVDFGLVAFRDRAEQGGRGTPGYAAPEVVRGQAAGPAADLYGLGATLFALVTGKPPFDSDGMAATLALQRDGAPRAVALEEAGAPRALIETTLHLLAPDPTERPGSAREVRLAFERLEPSVRVPLAERLRSTTRVGRERELARIEQWMSQERARGPVMFVSGASGAGVSVVVREVAARATLGDRPVVAFSAAALDGVGATARAVLRALAARSAPGAAGPVARLLGTERPLRESDLEDWAAAGRECVGTGLSPVVALDDAASIDDWSAAWIRRIALHEGAPGLLWVLGHPHPRGDERWRVLLETGNAHAIPLDPLSDADIARLATARLGAEPPAELLLMLIRQGGGHPGLTVELLLALAERGAMVEDEQGVRLVEGALLHAADATHFERSRLARLDGLGTRERTLAAVLAVCGPSLEPDAVARLAGGARAEDADRLVAEGFAIRDAEGRLMLHPPGLAKRIAQALPGEERTGLHRAALGLPGRSAAQRFEHHLGAGDPEGALAAAEAAFAERADHELAARAAEIAESWDAGRAADWHARAAEQLRLRGRYAPMIPHLRRALELEPHARADERSIALVIATLRSGDPAVAMAIATRELDAGAPPSTAAHLLANRAAARLMTGDLDSADRDAREALGLATSAGDAVGEGLAAEVLVVCEVARSRLDGAEAWCARAEDAFRRAGHVVGRTRALGSRAQLALERGDSAAALGQVEAALELARTLESRLSLTEQLLRSSVLHTRLGRWTRAREAAAEALRLAVEDGRGVETAVATTQLAQCDALLGRSRAAWRGARRAILLAGRHQPGDLAFAWQTRAQAERIRGRHRHAEHAARRALALADPAQEMSQWARIELGRALAAQDRWGEARAVWDAFEASATERHEAAAAMRRLWSARAALRQPDLELATRRRAAAGDWLDRHEAPWYHAVARLADAELALARRRAREGIEHANAALAGFAKLPAPAERARAALDLARLAMPLREARAHVVAWLDDAARTFERLGDARGRARALSLLVDWLKLAPAPAMVARDRGLFERVSWLLSSLTDTTELMRRAMRAAVEQLDAERGLLLLVDPSSGQIAPVAEYGGIEASTRHDALGYSRRVVQHVTRGGDSLLIVDADSDPRAASQSVEDMQLRSILCVPLFVGGRTVGAVYLDDSRRSHAFAETDRGMIEGFAHLMAVAIEKSRSHDEVRRENERLEGENLSLRREVAARVKWQGVVGTSSAMQDVLRHVEKAARTNVTVLITGENGTGKELIARTLHRSGKRAMGPFVEVNCGAIPETLLESELFGILSNVATGVRGRPGKFALADGGTLFLDEVGEMPVKQQVALLRALATREVTPVGGGRSVSVDVRVIAATNRDLRRLVQEGGFREDLFYRLNVIEIRVPPLRERKADIPPLTRHFVDLFSRQQEREAPDISPDFLAVLMRSDWPGNVRELQNYVERLIAMTPGNELRPDPLPRDLDARVAPARRGPGGLVNLVHELEKKLIVEALERADGNQSRAARDLGLPEQSLRYRLRKFGLGPREDRRTRHFRR